MAFAGDKFYTLDEDSKGSTAIEEFFGPVFGVTEVDSIKTLWSIVDSALEEQEVTTFNSKLEEAAVECIKRPYANIPAGLIVAYITKDFWEVKVTY